MFYTEISLGYRSIETLSPEMYFVLVDGRPDLIDVEFG